MTNKKPPYLWYEPPLDSFRGERRILRLMCRDKKGVKFKDIGFNGIEELKNDLNIELNEVIGARIYSISPREGNFSEKVFLQYDKFLPKLKKYQKEFEIQSKRSLQEKEEKKEEAEERIEEQKETLGELENKVNEKTQKENKFAVIRGGNIWFGNKKERFDTLSYRVMGKVNPVSEWIDYHTPKYRTKKKIFEIAKEMGANIVAKRGNDLIAVKYFGNIEIRREYIF